MRSTKIIQICSSSLCTCLHHMVILRTRNKITDFFMILAWASPFNSDISNASLIGYGPFFQQSPTHPDVVEESVQYCRDVSSKLA